MTQLCHGISGKQKLAYKLFPNPMHLTHQWCLPSGCGDAVAMVGEICSWPEKKTKTNHGPDRLTVPQKPRKMI